VLAGITQNIIQENWNLRTLSVEIGIGPVSEKHDLSGLSLPVFNATSSIDSRLLACAIGNIVDGMISARRSAAISAAVVGIAAIGWLGLRNYDSHAASKRRSAAFEIQSKLAKQDACKRRGAAYETQVENIKQDAHDQLKIGTKKADVSRFFSEHNIPFDFFGSEARGTLSASGCAPFGCGTDSAQIGVRVHLSQAGVVTGEPKVVAFYTDCL
jgi:hypothetical protein